MECVLGCREKAITMLISASYKTDIPAFYGQWFMNRLDAGYCLVLNPYDRRRASRVSLLREDVDGFVFWTKNLAPFTERLMELKRRGFPFIIHYTINAYPRKLEFSVTDATRSLGHAADLAANYGPDVLIWRYDPIIISSETSLESHIENFSWLASRLSGATNEVVVSFVQLYDKTRKNMDWASREFDFSWTDPDDSQKRQLLQEFQEIASAHGIKLSLCAQPHLLGGQVAEARCVDARRISKIIGQELGVRLKGPRPGCGCFESRDIGDYDTCPHGCVYCYAVRNRKMAQARYRKHDPTAEFLFAPANPVNTDSSENRTQTGLFEGGGI